LPRRSHRSPEDFVSALIAANLPLAGRCAAQPDVAVSPALRERLQQALVERSRDPAADLRARIAAARALGELGDPRFERRRGPLGEYLLPPLVAIASGSLPHRQRRRPRPEDEAPAHSVELAAFRTSPASPVTNAEWRLASSPPAATTTSAGGRPKRRSAGAAARVSAEGDEARLVARQRLAVDPRLPPKGTGGWSTMAGCHRR
jgi:formylglycine-generating enzyme required for sulfatase activity